MNRFSFIDEVEMFRISTFGERIVHDFKETVVGQVVGYFVLGRTVVLFALNINIVMEVIRNFNIVIAVNP